MNEDAENATGTTEEATAPEDSGYSSVLEGKGTEPQDSPTGTPEEGEIQPEKPETENDPEITVEIGGKTFSGKQSEILDRLENWSKVAEKEKSLNRDYTQKTQALGEVRKSFESSFGRMPEKQEIAAMGKLYQAYFADEKSAQVIDAILSGSLDQVLGGVQPKPQSSSPQTPEVRALKQEMSSLRAELQRDKELSQKAQSEKTWNSWVEKMVGQKVQISEDIEKGMVPFISAFSQSHSEWDDNKILDEAYRYATIDKLPLKIASNVLVDADKAKKTNPPKITPRATQKSDSEKSYADIFAG